ncbi:MAG: acyl carrier protein [Caulobacteraceae bacterium]
MDVSEEDILSIFTAETGVERARLLPTATLASLDIASLDIIGVSFAIEDKYGVVVDAEAFVGCETLQDAVDMIRQRVQSSAASS